MFRQGDILFIEMDTEEALAVIGSNSPVERENGHIILAYGEVTGHHHAVAEVQANLFEVDSSRILISPVPMKVVHEEHAAVALPGGAFRVVQQVEYTPGAVRRVTD